MTTAILIWPKHGIGKDSLTFRCPSDTATLIKANTIHKYHDSFPLNMLIEAEVDELIIVIPASYILRIQKSINQKQANHIKKTFPYIIEEQLCEDVNSYSFGYIYNKTKNQLNIFAIDKNILLAIKKTCILLTANYVRIIPQPHNILIRKNIETIDNPTIKSTSKTSTHDINNITTETTNNRFFFNKFLKSIESRREENTTITYTSLTNLLDSKSIPHIHCLSPSLYSEKKLNISYILGSIFVFFIIISSILNTIIGLKHKENASLFEKESITSYKNQYPNEKKIYDLKRQLEGKINQAPKAKNDRLTAYLHQLALATKKANQNIIIKSINYNQENNTLKVTIISSSRDDVLKLKEVNSTKYKTSIKSISENAESIITTLEISDI